MKSCLFTASILAVSLMSVESGCASSHIEIYEQDGKLCVDGFDSPFDNFSVMKLGICLLGSSYGATILNHYADKALEKFFGQEVHQDVEKSWGARLGKSIIYLSLWTTLFGISWKLIPAI